MLPHRMTVQRYLGASATGPAYAPAAEVRCYIEDKLRSVRTPDGRDVVAASVIRCNPDRSITSESKISTWGKPREVIAVTHFDFPGTPSHTEVYLQ